MEHHEEHQHWFLILLSLVIGARAVGAIKTSWWIILAPIWIPYLIIFLVLWYMSTQ